MSSKRKMFLVFCFSILNVFLLIGFLVIRDATFLNMLKKEEIELLKLSMTNGNYQREIQSRGNYATVEKTIKNYLNDYTVLLQDTLHIMDDETLTKVLSYDNYCKDGPEFTNSLAYLTKLKKKFNGNVDTLLAKGKEENIRKEILNETDDEYFINLYNDFMLNSDIKQKFSDNNQLIINTQTKVNRVIDGSVEVLNFLIVNKDSWKVEDGKIQFLTQDLYNQYMSYIAKVS